MNRTRRRRVGTLIGVTALLAALAVPTALPASAVEVPDQVLAWNQHAYDELILGAPATWKSPVVSALHLAMVHGAVYDAVNAIAGGYEPYLVAPAVADPTDSEDAAAAAAGYHVLLDILKPPLILEADVPAVAARLQGYYDASLAAILGAGVPQSSIDGGVAVGNAAAQAMIAERTGDGRYGEPSFDVGFDTGEWRPLAEGLLGNNFRWTGDVAPFLVPKAAMFGTRGPNAVASAKYTREFNRVKSLGAIDSTTRKADQTAMAIFWADHAIGMWTRIFRQLSEANHLSTAGERSIFRDALPHRGGRRDRLPAGQGGMELLAADDSDPGSRNRRQPVDGGRRNLGVAQSGSALSRASVRAQLRQLVDRGDPEGLLRDEPHDVQRDTHVPAAGSRTDHAHVHAVLPGGSGDHFERVSSGDCTSGPRTRRVHDSVGGSRTGDRSTTSSPSP